MRLIFIRMAEVGRGEAAGSAGGAGAGAGAGTAAEGRPENRTHRKYRMTRAKKAAAVKSQRRTEESSFLRTPHYTRTGT